ncbi:MAG: hypothetical protein ACPL7A_03730, partial [Anaerolineales bacterium]
YGDTLGNGKNNFENNTLQWNPYRRFIDLEEADGIQDLGFIMTYGESDDYFFAPHKDRFTPETTPNTNSNTNAKSFISITNISSSKEIMSFDVAREHRINVFMRYAPGKSFSPLVVGEFFGRKSVLVSAGERIYGWYGNGEGIFGINDTVGLIDYKGDTIFVPVSVFVRSTGEESFSAPTMWDLDGDGSDEILVAGYSGRFYVFKYYASTNSHAEIIFETNFNAPFVLPPLVLKTDYGMRIFLGSSQGKFFILDSLMNLLGSGDVKGEIRGAQVVEARCYILAERAKGILFAYDIESDSICESVQLSGGNFAPLMKGDWNGDGRSDILAFSRDGFIYAFDGV